MPPDYDDNLLRALALEGIDLRELCEGVAQELERLAAHRTSDPSAFVARAARIRARLQPA